MRSARCGSLNICVTTWRNRPIAPSDVPLPQKAVPDVNSTRPRVGTDQPHGESTRFLRSCAASCFLHTTGCSTSRVFVIPARFLPLYKPKSSSHCCLLCVRCVKLRKSRIKNLSHRLFHMLNLFRYSFHLCPTILTTSSGAICLYLVSRERGLQKLHSFVAPTMLPWRGLFAVGNARRIEKHVPRRGSEGRKPQGWNLCGPKSVIESQKLADAWERIWRSDQSRRLLEGFLCRTWLVEGDVASFQPFAAAKAYSEAARGRRGTKWDNPSCRCL